LEDDAVSETIIKMESQVYFSQYKFGVLFAKTGQIAEDQLYENSETSEDFNEFLNWLGNKIKLAGWTKFRGGLDTRGSDCTGSHSYYTEFCKQEIMYHVAYLMPIKDNDPSRKRYIGNDVVVIIFKEGPNDKFDAKDIRSQFNHIFAVVEKVKTPSGPAYRIEIAQKQGVLPYPPFLPDPPIFPINAETRAFFLTKLINAERSAILHVPIFKANMANTREALIADVIKSFTVKKVKKPEVSATPSTASSTTTTTATTTTTITTSPSVSSPQSPSQTLEAQANDQAQAEEDKVDYDKLEELIMAALCAENKIQYTNINSGIELLAAHYGVQ